MHDKQGNWKNYPGAELLTNNAGQVNYRDRPVLPQPLYLCGEAAKPNGNGNLSRKKQQDPLTALNRRIVDCAESRAPAPIEEASLFQSVSVSPNLSDHDWYFLSPLHARQQLGALRKALKPLDWNSFCVKLDNNAHYVQRVVQETLSDNSQIARVFFYEHCGQYKQIILFLNDDD
jgi:hypothetical protein